MSFTVVYFTRLAVVGIDTFFTLALAGKQGSVDTFFGNELFPISSNTNNYSSSSSSKSCSGGGGGNPNTMNLNNKQGGSSSSTANASHCFAVDASCLGAEASGFYEVDVSQVLRGQPLQDFIAHHLLRL